MDEMVKITGLKELEEEIEGMIGRTTEAARAIENAEGNDQAEEIMAKLGIKNKPMPERPLIETDNEAEAKQSIENGYPVPEHLATYIGEYILDQ
jgi:hypothetical protein